MTRASAAVIALLIAVPAAFAQSTTPPTPNPHERPKVYSSQPGQTGASELVGASVHAQSGELIGHVNEIILGNDGRVAVVVVGVSNLLGLGEREIAIDYAALSVLHDPVAMPHEKATTVIVDATSESVKTAPEWR